ncbi:hypothetical protein BJX76DRAFT_354732 [Aspergillus varians]
MVEGFIAIIPLTQTFLVAAYSDKVACYRMTKNKNTKNQAFKKAKGKKPQQKSLLQVIQSLASKAREVAALREQKAAIEARLQQLEQSIVATHRMYPGARPLMETIARAEAEAAGVVGTVQGGLMGGLRGLRGLMGAMEKERAKWARRRPSGKVALRPL